MGTQEIGINFPEVAESKHQFTSKQKVNKKENFGDRIRQVIKRVQRRKINLESDIKQSYRAQRTAELYELLDSIGRDEDTLELARAKQRVRESIQNVQAEIQDYVAQQLVEEQPPKIEQKRNKSTSQIMKSQLENKISLQKRGVRQVKSSPVLKRQPSKAAVVTEKDRATRKTASTSDVALTDIFHHNEAYLHHVYGKPLYTGTRFTQKDPYLRFRSSPLKQKVHRPLQMKDMQSMPEMRDGKSSPSFPRNQFETVTSNAHLSAIPLAPPKRTREPKLIQENIGSISVRSQKNAPTALTQSNVAVLTILTDQKDTKQLTHQKLPSLHIEGKGLPSSRKNTKIVTFRENDLNPPQRPVSTESPLPNAILEQVYIPSNSSQPPELPLAVLHNQQLMTEFANQGFSELLNEVHISSYRTEQELIARVLTEVYPSRTEIPSEVNPSRSDLALPAENAAVEDHDHMDKDLIKRLVLEVIKENMSHLWTENVEDKDQDLIKKPLSSEENEVIVASDNELSNEFERSNETGKEQNDKTDAELNDKTDSELSSKTDTELSNKTDTELSNKTDTKLSDKTDSKLSIKTDTQESSNYNISEERYNPDNLTTSTDKGINEADKNRAKEVNNDGHSKMEQKEDIIDSNFAIVYHTPDVSQSQIIEQPPTPSRTPSPEQQILNFPALPPLSDDEDLQRAKSGTLPTEIIPTPERTPPATPSQKIILTPVPSPPFSPVLRSEPEAMEPEVVPFSENGYELNIKDAEVQVTPPDPVTDMTLSTSVTTSEGLDLLLSEGEVPYRNWGQATLSGIPEINLDCMKNVEISNLQETDKIDINSLDQNNSVSEGEIPMQFFQRYSKLCTAADNLQLEKELNSAKDIKSGATSAFTVDQSRSLSSSQDLSVPDLSEGQIPKQIEHLFGSSSKMNATLLQNFPDPLFTRPQPSTSSMETTQSLSEGEIICDVQSILDLQKKNSAIDGISATYKHDANSQNRTVRLDQRQLDRLKIHPVECKANPLNRIVRLDQKQLDDLKFHPVLSTVRLRSTSPTTEVKYPYTVEENKPAKSSASPIVIGTHPVSDREYKDISSSFSEGQVEVFEEHD